MAEPPDLDSEEDVRRRVATGELVKHAAGTTPVRDHVVAQLRAHMARPREKPRKE
jgi:hypothetical protein